MFKAIRNTKALIDKWAKESFSIRVVILKFYTEKFFSKQNERNAILLYLYIHIIHTHIHVCDYVCRIKKQPHSVATAIYTSALY